MNALIRWLHRAFNTRTYQNIVNVELSEKMNAVAVAAILRESNPNGILWKIRNGLA